VFKVKECMSKKIVKAKRGTPLSEIIKFFKENRFHTLPVVDEEKLIGVISLNEITAVFKPHSAEINKLLETVPFIDSVPETELDINCLTPEMGILVVADELLTKRYHTIGPDKSVSEAFIAMQENNTKMLMVTEDGKLVGIISMFDIIYALFKEKGVIK
jgi:predicted transcriptional regulator